MKGRKRETGFIGLHCTNQMRRWMTAGCHECCFVLLHCLWWGTFYSSVGGKKVCGCVWWREAPKVVLMLVIVITHCHYCCGAAEFSRNRTFTEMKTARNVQTDKLISWKQTATFSTNITHDIISLFPLMNKTQSITGPIRHRTFFNSLLINKPGSTVPPNSWPLT